MNVPDALFVDLFESVGADDRVNESESESASSYQSFKDNHHSTELRMKGNVKFRLNLYTEALELYNQSLCFAEIGSVNVGLAYAGRSACFSQMQMHDKALIDVEFAKISKLPERLMLQLKERKRQSLKILNSIEQSKTLEISSSPEYSEIHSKNLINNLKSDSKSNYSGNPNYPCMSDVLELQQNQRFGRHLIAKCDIPAGQTVLIEEDFVSIRSDSRRVCYTCFHDNSNLIACPQCPDAMFCSADCMNRNLTHKWECGTFFAQLHYKIRFQMRSILVALEIFPNIEDLVDFVERVLLENCEKMPESLHTLKEKYHFFLKLEMSSVFCSKYSTTIYKIYEDLMLLPKVCALFDSEKKKRFLMHLVVHHFLVLKNNSIASGKPWSMVSVFNVLSMMNHSCAPNVYHPRIGKRQHCVTIKPVKKGEQLFISYLLLGKELLKEQRQEKLKTSWGFLCECERCDNTLVDKTSVDLELIASDLCYRFVIDNYQHENEAEPQDEIMEKCISFLNKYGHSEWSLDIFTMAAILVNLYVEKQVQLDEDDSNRRNVILIA